MDSTKRDKPLDIVDSIYKSGKSYNTDRPVTQLSIITHLRHTFQALLASLLAIGLISIGAIFYLNSAQNTLSTKIEPLQNDNNLLNSKLLQVNIAIRSFVLTGKKTFVTDALSDEKSYQTIYDRTLPLQSELEQGMNLLPKEHSAALKYFSIVNGEAKSSNTAFSNPSSFSATISTIGSSLGDYESINSATNAVLSSQRNAFQNREKIISTLIIALDIALLALVAASGLRRTRKSTKLFSQLISRITEALSTTKLQEMKERLSSPASKEEVEIGSAIVAMTQQRQILELQLEQQYQQEKTSRESLEEERSLRAVLADTLYRDLDTASAFRRALAGFGNALRADRAIIRTIENGVPGTAVFNWESPNLPESTEATNGSDVTNQIRRIIYEESPEISQAIYHGRYVTVNDVANDQRLSERSRIESLKTGLGAFIAVPVIGNSGPEAVLVALVEGRSRNWSDRDTQIGTTLAAGLSATLAAINLYDQEKRNADKMRELDQAKDNFVASVSHELRTPLTSIIGYLELLQDEVEAKNIPAEYARMLDAIDRNSQRLLSLIENILTTSRIESGKLEVINSTVHVSTLLVIATETVMPQITAKNINLEIRVPNDLPDLTGDPALLDRALLNLLSNAIKFTPEHGTISVSAWHDSSEIAIQVRDTGMGIPEDELDMLFTKFFRSSKALENAVQGTGLGLTIVKAIIEAHGGYVSVESATDLGTAFILHIPCK